MKAGKPRDQGRSYRPVSLLCPAVKILERLFLPSIVEALGTRPSKHGFKSRHSTASALLPISARVVSGFSQRKPPSSTIPIVLDISKAVDTVSHRLLIEMIHRSRLRHNLVKWLGIPPRQEGIVYLSAAALVSAPSADGGPTGIRHLPSPLQPLCFRLPNSRFDVLADDFTMLMLASTPSIVEADARANLLCSSVVRWADCKQLAIHCLQEIQRDTVHL